MELSPGRKRFEEAREIFAYWTGQELFVDGWDGLTDCERAEWNLLAHEREEQDRD